MDRSCDSSPQSFTTTHEQFTTLRAFPSLSKTPINQISIPVLHLQSRYDLQRPAHSPNCFPSGTLIKGILCSEHSATTNFLYASSSHASLRTHICAWRLSRAFDASRRPRARPSCMRASLRTPFRASRTDIWPLLAAASPATSTSSASATSAAGEVGSSTSDCDIEVNKLIFTTLKGAKIARINVTSLRFQFQLTILTVLSLIVRRPRRSVG